MRPDIVRIVVLAQAIGSVNTAELEILARSFDIVVDHVDEDRAAEQTLFLEDLVDQVELVPDRLLLLFSELRLLGTLTTKTDCLTSLHLEGREHVLEAGEESLLLLDHRHSTATKVPLPFILEQVAHANVVDFAVSFVDVRD